MLKIMGKSWKRGKRGGRQTKLAELNRGGGSIPGREGVSCVDISSSNEASFVLTKIERANKNEGNVPSIVFGWRPLKMSREMESSQTMPTKFVAVQGLYKSSYYP
uniref:Uncharacterized protein n=1 Tax=Glossina austeni TaxID=7395 RepID=A0A1A9VXG5_GLOAU